MAAIDIFDVPTERERERLKKERGALEDQREKEYRRRGLEPARDRAGRAFPSGRLEPGEEGLIDLDRRREVDREVLAKPLTEEGEREVWREQNREQFEELEAEERRLSGQIKEFEDLKKEVLEQRGIPFDDSSDELIPLPPVDEERMEQLEREAGQKVGFLRGMLSPSLERGDSTPAAREAERRIEQAEPRLKEWRLVKERLNRIDELRERARENLKETESRRHNLELQMRGVVDPDSEGPENRFDQPGRRESEREPEPTARMLRPGEKPPERPADHHRFVEGIGGREFVHDIPKEEAPERIAEYDEQREREAEQRQRSVPDPLADPEREEGETVERPESVRGVEAVGAERPQVAPDDPLGDPEGEQGEEVALPAPETDPLIRAASGGDEELASQLTQQRTRAIERRRTAGEENPERREISFKPAEEGDPDSGLTIQHNGTPVASFSREGEISWNEGAEPEKVLRAMADDGIVPESQLPDDLEETSNQRRILRPEFSDGRERAFINGLSVTKDHPRAWITETNVPEDDLRPDLQQRVSEGELSAKQARKKLREAGYVRRMEAGGKPWNSGDLTRDYAPPISKREDREQGFFGHTLNSVRKAYHRTLASFHGTRAYVAQLREGGDEEETPERYRVLVGEGHNLTAEQKRKISELPDSATVTFETTDDEGQFSIVREEGESEVDQLLEAARNRMEKAEAIKVEVEGIEDVKMGQSGGIAPDAARWAISSGIQMISSVASILAGGIGGGVAGGKAGGVVGGPKGVAIGTATGSAIGSFTVGHLLYSGDLFQTITEAGVDPDEAASTATKYAIPASAVSIVFPASVSALLVRSFGREHIKGVIKNELTRRGVAKLTEKQVASAARRQAATEAGKYALIGAPAEGIAEGLAEAFVVAGEAAAIPGYEISDEEYRSRVTNATAAGALMGTGMGSARFVSQRKASQETIDDVQLGIETDRLLDAIETMSHKNKYAETRMLSQFEEAIEAGQTLNPEQQRLYGKLKKGTPDPNPELSQKLDRQNFWADKVFNREDLVNRERLEELVPKQERGRTTFEEDIEVGAITFNKPQLASEYYESRRDAAEAAAVESEATESAPEAAQPETPAAPAEAETPATEATEPTPVDAESTPAEAEPPAEAAPKPIPEAVTELAEATPKLRELVQQGATNRKLLFETGSLKTKVRALDSEGNPVELGGKQLAEEIRKELSRPEPRFIGYQEGADGQQVAMYNAPKWDDIQGEWTEDTVTREGLEERGIEVPETPAPPEATGGEAATETPLGLFRDEVVDPSLSKMEEAAFDRHKSQVNKRLDKLEKELDEGEGELADLPQEFRERLAQAQDDYSAVQNEQLRRDAMEWSSDEIANQIRNLSMSTDQGKTKAAIIVDSVRHRGDFDEVIDALTKLAEQSPDHAEVIEGKLRDLGEISGELFGDKRKNLTRPETPAPPEATTVDTQAVAEGTATDAEGQEAAEAGAEAEVATQQELPLSDTIEPLPDTKRGLVDLLSGERPEDAEALTEWRRRRKEWAAIPKDQLKSIVRRARETEIEEANFNSVSSRVQEEIKSVADEAGPRWRTAIKERAQKEGVSLTMARDSTKADSVKALSAAIARNRIEAESSENTQGVNPRSRAAYTSGVEAMPDTSNEGVVTESSNVDDQTRFERVRPKDIRRSETIQKLSEVLGIPIRKGRWNILKRRALGAYAVRPEAIRMRSMQDVRTAAHEVGHHVHKLIFGTTEKGALNQVPLVPFRDELLSLTSRAGFAPAQQTPKEGLAEYFAHYVTNPEVAERMAPRFHAHIEQVLSDSFPQIREMLIEARERWQLWENAPGQAQIDSMISDRRNPIRWNIKNAWRRFRMEVLDDLEPIRRFSDQFDKTDPRGKLEGMLEVQARTSRASAGTAETFLSIGAIDFNTMEVIGPALDSILKPVIHTRKDYKAFRRYAIAKRVIELADRDIHKGISREAAEQTISELETDQRLYAFEQMQEWNRNLLAYIRDAGVITQELYNKIVEKNQAYVPMISAELDSRFSGATGKSFSHIFSPIKAIKGSESDIIDPLEVMVKHAFSYAGLAHRQEVSNSLARLAGEEGAGSFLQKIDPPMRPVKVHRDEVKKWLKEQGAEIETADDSALDEMMMVFRPGDYFGDQNVISHIKENGKREWFEVVDEQMAKSISSLKREDLNALTRIAAIPSRWLRAGATGTPDFAVRNVFRDQIWSPVLSENIDIPFAHVTRGIISAWRHSKGDDGTVQKWKTAGGQFASIVDMDRTWRQNTIKSMVVGGIPNVVTNPIALLRTISRGSENASRLGEFQAALNRFRKEGFTGRELYQRAALSAREVGTDYMRRGADPRIRAIRMIATFWNPKIQSWDRVGRAFFRNPARTTVKSLMWVTLPSMLLYYVNRDDPEYQEIPQWQKDLFWLVKIPRSWTNWAPDWMVADLEGAGGGRAAADRMVLSRIQPLAEREDDSVWLRIPKPFQLGLIFGSIPERLMEWADSKDRTALDRSLSRIVGYDPSRVDATLSERMSDATQSEFGQILMPDIQAFTPFLENWANYSRFRQRPIVSRSQQDLRPEEQYGNYTSEIAKSIGATVGYSPAKIENLIESWTGGMGRYALDASDYAIRTAEGEPSDRPTRGWPDWPVLRSFTVRSPGFSSESIEEFYNEYSRAMKTHRTANRIKRDRPHEYQDFVEKNQNLLRRYEILHGRKAAIDALRDQSRTVADDSDLGRREKQRRIDELGREAMEVARRAMEVIRRAE